jgi:hypothetical protein
MKEKKNVELYEGQSFEEIKHIDEFGEEYWYAHFCKLQKLQMLK